MYMRSSICGPVLRLGAAGPGIHFKVGVIGVGLAREQALDLVPLRLGGIADSRSASGGRDGRLVALGLGQFDQFQRVGDITLELLDPFDLPGEPPAFAHHAPRFGGIVP